jgi:AcrR family transcriptional regulator
VTEQKKRGTYAKGDAKREEVLLHAIDVFGRLGYHATSMREIARECGLSQAGLLHHFPTKQALLLALVESREENQTLNQALETKLWTEAFYEQMLENLEAEPLTRLWANLVGEATDRSHPAHQYFLQRYSRIRESFAMTLAQGDLRKTVTHEDRIRASILIALWDGLQTQWLLDDDFDMCEPFEYAMKLLSQKPIKR